MIGLLCFALAVLTSPFKSKLRLVAENAALLTMFRKNAFHIASRLLPTPPDPAITIHRQDVFVVFGPRYCEDAVEQGPCRDRIARCEVVHHAEGRVAPRPPQGKLVARGRHAAHVFQQRARRVGRARHVQVLVTLTPRFQYPSRLRLMTCSSNCSRLK